MFIPRITRSPVWAPADDAGGGDGGDDAGAAAVAAAAEGGDKSGGEGGKSSILDFARKGGDADPDGDGDAWKLPDGLEVAEHLVGTSAEDTISKLAVAYKGMRTDLATRKKADGVLEGDVPKDIEGYKFTGEAENNPILDDLNSEASKPIVDAWRAAALETGIPDAAFSQFMQLGIAKMAEGGNVLNLGQTPDQATQIAGEAEYANLVEVLGQAGADQAVRQIDTYAVGIAERGILQNQAEVDEFGQMVGTSLGLQIMQRIIVEEFGEKPIPRGDGGEGTVTLDEAYAQHAAAMAMDPGSSGRESAITSAEAAIAKAMRQGSTQGQITSKIL